MKPPFSSLLSTRSFFGPGSFVVAFCISALLGSARADGIEDDPAIAASVTNLAVSIVRASSASSAASDDSATLEQTLFLVNQIYTILNNAKMANNGIRTVPYATSGLTGSTIGAYLGWGLYADYPGLSASPSSIRDTSYLKLIRDYLVNIPTNSPPFDFVDDNHGSELLVNAPDLEYLVGDGFNTLSYIQQSIGSDLSAVLYTLDAGLSVSVDGGEITLNGEADVNVRNWPDYFTGEYDSTMADELQSYSEYEYDWDDQVDESSYLADVSEDDASEDSPYLVDVTNAVNSVVLDTADQDESLPIRDQVFNSISDDLIPASAVNRNFSSDVLILPAVPSFHIPELAWDGNDDFWQGFLSRSGSLMSSLYDVLYALFVIWLIWREYNFYFRTM